MNEPTLEDLFHTAWKDTDGYDDVYSKAWFSAMAGILSGVESRGQLSEDGYRALIRWMVTIPALVEYGYMTE